MAEFLLDVATSLVTNLCSLALEKLGLIWSVNDELEKLKSTVSSIEAVLLDAEEQQSKSNAVRDWLSKLKDVFYDAEDLIDEFSYEALKRQVTNEDGKMTKRARGLIEAISVRNEMGSKLKDIREKLEALAADKTQFNFSERVRDTTQDDWLRERRNTHSFVPDEEVVGRDADKEVIMDHLMDTNITENISVLAIVGIGGLGKTSLAQYVYNDEKIIKHFELKLWVCISEEFDVKIIVENLIESATKEKTKPRAMDLLQSELRREIDGKKYLIIMDDVWNINHNKWVSVKRLLMGGAKGSKIVITTRLKQVARICDANIIYPLEGLFEDDSWLLFKQMAFKGGEEVENPNLIKIGKDIAAQLKGVPLAIRLIGRLLYDKKSEDDWLSFKDNELYTVMQEENEMQSILKLSYNHLPSDLKKCLTYCALFPKDYVIRKSEMVTRWVAQGFVQPHGRNNLMEDVGNEYFMELLWSSFFQDVQRDLWGDMIGCKMHDLMHDLACSITKNECVHVNVDGRPIDKRTRHVSFKSNIKELPESIFEANNLRSFLFYHSDFYPGSDCCELPVNKILCKFLHLRTLEMGYSGILRLPECINKLKHLRYLDLSKNELIEFLPNSITELYNLETLILSYCSRLRELPRDIKNLIHLRHLALDGCDLLSCMPKGLGGMTHLVTLSLFVLAKDDGNRLKELKGFSNLRGPLTVRGLNFCKALLICKKKDYLEMKSGLRVLNLEWDHDKDNYSKVDVLDDNERVLECLQPHPNVREIRIKGYGGIRLCKWLSFNSLDQLVEINLTSCERLIHLPQFDQFPVLKSLFLFNLKSMEYIDSNDDSRSSSTFFPSLKFLCLAHMPNLKGWWKWKGETSTESSQTLPTFPRLSHLLIDDCCQLIDIPWHPPPVLLRLFGDGKQALDMVIKTTTGLDGESSSPLFKLEELHLCGINNIEFLPEELSCNPSALDLLVIGDCDNLQLCFSCEDNDGELWKNLGRLRYLIIQGVPKLEYLPKGMQHLTTLRNLILKNCQNLKSLPEWIGNLSSLRGLHIDECINLTSLPEGMSHLTSLRSLNIRGCPILFERCKKGIGEDWPKIAHVPEFNLE